MGNSGTDIANEPEIDPRACAERAGLVYVTGDEPGYARRKRGRGFTYLDPAGTIVLDEEARSRIAGLVIPPAWTEVWICTDAKGHIQATGRDSEGRKQYIYHPEWEQLRHQLKFSRMIAFGRALPSIRERCDADLRKHGLPREKALAAVVFVLDRTLIRVGNMEYAERNGSFGLTTLRDRHVDFSGRRCTFHFRGKGGKDHVVEMEDERLARIIRRCRDVPGQTLFQYYADDGSRCSVDSTDVNSFIRESTRESFTAKDFRTWGASVHAAVFLNAVDKPSTEKQADKHIVDAVKMVAKRLGNTPAICRDYYIHPEIYRVYRLGRLRELFSAGLRRKTPSYLDPEEVALLHLLEKTCAR